MRYTANHGGVHIIPKELLSDAAKKLAGYEDVEEREEINSLINDMRKTAKAIQEKDPVIASMLRRAAAMITVVNDFDNAESLILRKKMTEQRMQLLDFLDEIDGQLLDDPVGLIREKVEEVLG